MIDQKRKICEGIRAEFVGQAQEDEKAVSAVVNGEVQLVYISPENLLCNSTFQNMLLSDKYKQNLLALAVDEARCVKLWYDIILCLCAHVMLTLNKAEDFRQVFHEIGSLRSLVPKSVKIMALTATATQDTFDCVLEHLSLEIL